MPGAVLVAADIGGRHLSAFCDSAKKVNRNYLQIPNSMQAYNYVPLA